MYKRKVDILNTLIDLIEETENGNEKNARLLEIAYDLVEMTLTEGEALAFRREGECRQSIYIDNT